MRNRGLNNDIIARNRGLNNDIIARNRGLNNDIIARNRGLNNDIIARNRGLNNDILDMRTCACYRFSTDTPSNISDIINIINKFKTNTK